jgi:alanine racemase
MRATQALIHLGNLRHNLAVLREHIGRGSSAAPVICAAVKADAYGHGIVPIARTLYKEGVEYFGVATLDEAESLRSAGLNSIDILLYSIATRYEIPRIVELGVCPFVADREYIRRLSVAARERNRRIKVHLKIDTGMGRIGCSPDRAVELASYIRENEKLHLAGVATHFPAADEDDSVFTRNQIQLFQRVVHEIQSRGIDPGLIHAANSGAVIGYPDSWFDLVRPGISLYGYYPSRRQKRILDLRPVMEFVSRVVFIKEVPPDTPISYGSTCRTGSRTTIGTIPAGYGDGYNRLLSNSARVVISGKSYPVVGRICMDQFMVDLGPSTQTEIGDDVTLWGPIPGGPDAEEIAETTGTVPYEILCNVAKRVPRIYLD